MPKQDFDEIDQQIIAALRQNPRAMSTQIARALGKSEPTIRRRLAQILSSGVVRLSASLDPARAGFAVQAYIGLEVRRDQIETVTDTLAAYDFVESVSIVTGPSHVLIRALFHNTQDVYTFVMHDLASLEGIVNTRTSIVLKDILR
ncbi:Lrp/AsnC family transcriptional regulator [Acuticoccus sediminis]|nr:Lrp/AsnC family transcriptional regulator [Acuticoccus sediminis]